MSDNKTNLEGLVSKLKEQGIDAGNEEKARIIASAKEEAAQIKADAEKQSKKIIEEANRKAEQLMGNAQTSIAQASRDMVEATRMTVLKFMKSVFTKQAEALFTQEQYSKELLKVVMEAIPGDKTVTVADEVLKGMEAFIKQKALSETIVLKPLGDNSAKIVVESSDKDDVQFVLDARDVEQGLFSMLNKDLVERITKGQGE
jgi:V/A-type H+-transporting ATPase subunit E